jgi:hypothetical protein
MYRKIAEYWESTTGIRCTHWMKPLDVVIVLNGVPVDRKIAEYWRSTTGVRCTYWLKTLNAVIVPVLYGVLMDRKIVEYWKNTTVYSVLIDRKPLKVVTVLYDVLTERKIAEYWEITTGIQCTDWQRSLNVETIRCTDGEKTPWIFRVYYRYNVYRYWMTEKHGMLRQYYTVHWLIENRRIPAYGVLNCRKTLITVTKYRYCWIGKSLSSERVLLVYSTVYWLTEKHWNVAIVLYGVLVDKNRWILRECYRFTVHRLAENHCHIVVKLHIYEKCTVVRYQLESMPLNCMLIL